jgi:pSer/pThr/pTyr-binding forkhead associated (FHA) protein/tetratricopeptide (TPR) repeat protein
MKGSRKSSLEEATLIKAVSEFEKSNKIDMRGPEAYPLLEIQSGPNQGAWFTLANQKEISIGRANVNSIVLEDSSVSRSHSAIHEVDGKYFVKDVGSRNGTFVNDKKIQEDYLLRKGDSIKVGIYVLKFLTEPAAESVEEPTQMEEEVLSLRKEGTEEVVLPPHEEEQVMEGTEEKTSTEKQGAVALSPQQEMALSQEEVLKPQRGQRVFKNLVYFLVTLILLGGVGFTVYRFYIKKKIYVAQKTPSSVVKTAPTPAQIPTTPPVVPSPSTQVSPPALGTETPGVVVPPAPVVTGPGVPIFVDVNAQPLQARIFYQGKELGVTPFKTNVTVPVGAPQEITAVYHFDELNQDFSEKKSFTVSKQDELVPIRFEGSIGSLSVKSLPRNVQVYLEGTFASNQLKAQAAKLGDIVYTHPIYLPFGNYTLEMKRAEKLEGSETVVDVVKYHREFVISKESPTYEVALTDQDLLVFPAKIKTNPEEADVIVDGKKYGETPFEGNLPLGKHNLVLKKDGFYDYEQPLTLTMNTSFVSEVTLKTSEAGQFINKGRELMRQGQSQQAIDQFAESLKHNPSPREIAQIQLLLGNAYIKTGANDIAISYFEKAKLNPEFKSQADLGIAEASLNAGNKDVALSRVIDVMLNEKDEKIKSDAETLFHKISPLKSVIFVSTEPTGAKISINGQEISQPTPVVLSDLGLGSYRLSIDKDGFKHFESRFSLALSTFKPVIVKLEPAP